MKKSISILLILGLCIATTPAVFAQSPFGDPPQNPMDPGIATDPGPTAVIDNPVNPGSGTNPGTGIGAGSGINAGTPTDPGVGNQVTGSGLLPVNQSVGNGIGTGGPTGVGYVVYGGNGNRQNFWEYLKDLFSLKGSDNQSTYKNQETAVVKYTDGTTAQQPKTLSSTSSSTAFSCKRNTSNKTLNGYLNLATCVVLALIPIIIAGLVLWFMFGAVKVLNDNEHESRNQYKQFLAWGVFIIFIALSFVGILRVLSKTLGL